MKKGYQGEMSEQKPRGGGGPGNTSLSGAVKELKSQHPIDYCEHGPHHGTSHHVRHERLGGLKPSAG